MERKVAKRTSAAEATSFWGWLSVRLKSCPSVLCLFGGLAVAISVSGCGYHQVGAATHLPPGVRTLAVPIFNSRVQAFRTETVFTQAVVHELNLRTKYRVLASSGDGTNAGATGDAVLRGTIVSETVAPLTYDQNSGQTASYLVTITASVVITAHDGTVLYKNDTFGWREQYQSTQDLSSFVQEDSAAVRRVAKDFSEALVSDILEGFK